MDVEREKKILELLTEINEKLDIISYKIDTNSSRLELLQYKEQFEKAQEKLQKEINNELGSQFSAPKE